MQSNVYRQYLRSYHMFKMSYHMVQVYIMNTADKFGPEYVLNDIDLIDYMLSVIENLEKILEYYDDPEKNVGFDIDKILDHTKYKLNGIRGMIEAEQYISTVKMYYKIQSTSSSILKYYIK